MGTRELDILADDAVRLAHDLNNMMQAVIGEIGIVRRRAARGEDVGPRLAQLERLVAECTAFVTGMRATLEAR